MEDSQQKLARFPETALTAFLMGSMCRMSTLRFRQGLTINSTTRVEPLIFVMVEPTF